MQGVCTQYCSSGGYCGNSTKYQDSADCTPLACIPTPIPEPTPAGGTDADEGHYRTTCWRRDTQNDLTNEELTDRLLQMEAKFQDLVGAVEPLVSESASLRATVAALSKNAMAAQAAAEEQVRSRGGSGLTGTRLVADGTADYQGGGFSNYAFANIHDHADHVRFSYFPFRSIYFIPPLQPPCLM